MMRSWAVAVEPDFVLFQVACCKVAKILVRTGTLPGEGSETLGRKRARNIGSRTVIVGFGARRATDLHLHRRPCILGGPRLCVLPVGRPGPTRPFQGRTPRTSSRPCTRPPSSRSTARAAASASWPPPRNCDPRPLLPYLPLPCHHFHCPQTYSPLLSGSVAFPL